MIRKYIILMYLFLIIGVKCISLPSVYCYDQPNESITQYIIEISKEIHYFLKEPDKNILKNSKGELKLKLLVSPWGEIKDGYISESSGNVQLDNICLETALDLERIQPFPEELGNKDLWIDVPIIFEIGLTRKKPLKPEEQPLEKKSTIGYKTVILEDNNYVKEDWFKKEPSIKYTPLKEVEEAVDNALQNTLSLKIAKEEVELSGLKIREARRALYPALSLNYLETTGKTTGTTQDFIDKEYKLKFEYPLYYGWRLKYAVEQAIANRNASVNNYDKAIQDIRAEVETSFYTYIAAKINLRLQRSLWGEVKNIVDIAKKRYDAGLSTKSEFLQTQSQYKQISYQIASSENELIIARLALAQAMKVDSKDVDTILNLDKDIELEPIELDIQLEDCLNLAFKYRPDLKAKEYMVKFNEYEHKIAQSKNQLKVDLTGSYGKSGGAYETEPLNLGSDWYLGIKVSKPLGGNTLSTSFTQDKTSIKHGQSTRTESESQAVEFGILDNLQSFSERKSALIGLDKAREELEKTKEAIIKEVEEAYLGLKKANVQVETSLNKLRYREEELKIAKARAELNDISLSELIQSYVNLTDEKLFYIEALGNSYQSLAKLNKATGYALYLSQEGIRLADRLRQ